MMEYRKENDMFTLAPKDTERFIEFEDLAHKLDKLLEWGLITETARKKEIIKAFEYYEVAKTQPILCDVIGYIPYNEEPDSPDTAVIWIEGKLHKIMPVYLKEMQKGTSKIGIEEAIDEVKQVVIEEEIGKVKQVEIEEESCEVKQAGHEEKVCETRQVVLEGFYEIGQTVLEEKPQKISGQVKQDKHIECDFVAIDFETANSKLNSACSVGIVAVENNEIVEKKYFLIKPPILRFDAENIAIHGITEADVANKAYFSGVWEEMKPYLSENLLVAHNAAFDMSVLRCCLKTYSISVPDTEYVCSIPVSTYAFKEKVGKSLGERTKLLGIDLKNAHNALDDAVACAELVIKTLQKNNKTSLHKFLTKNREINVKKLVELTPIEEFKKLGSKPKVEVANTSMNKPFNKPISKPSDKSARFKNNIRIGDVEATVDSIDEQNPIFNKAFVFTGDMQEISRQDAMQSVVNLGGIIKSGVSKKVDYVVVGVQDADLVGLDGMSSKERKAKELMQQGVDIKIIDEERFSQLINWK